MAGPSPATSSPVRRRWLRWLAALVVSLAVLAAGLWSARVPLAQWAVETYGARLGLGQPTLTVTRLELDGAAARDVRLGGLSAATITFSYDLADLRAGRLAAVEVDGLRLTGRLDAGGVMIDGLPLPTGDPTAPLAFPALPVARLALSDAVAVVATDAGPVRVAGQLDATQQDGGYAIAGALEATSPEGTAAVAFDGRLGPGEPDGVWADVDVTVSGQARDATIDVAGDIAASIDADWAGTVAMSLSDGAVQHPRATVDGLAGSVAVDLGAKTVDARLAYAAVRTERLDFGPGSATAEIAGDDVRLSADFDTARGRGTLAVATRLDAAAPLDVRLDGAAPAAALDLVPGVTAQAGEARVALAGTLPPLARLGARRTPAEWLAAARLDGTVELDVEGVAYAGVVDRADLDGRLRLDTTARELRIDAAAVTLGNMTLAPALRDRLPPFAAQLTDNATLRLLAPAVALAPAGPTVRLVTAAELDGLTAEIDATLALGPDLRPLRLDAPYASLSAEGLTLGDLRLDVDVLATGVAADNLAAAPRLAADIAVGASARASLPGVALADPRADLTARVTLDNDRLVLRPAAGSRVVVPGLGLRDRVALPRGVALAVAGDGGWLMADLVQGRLTYDVTLAPVALDAVVLLPGGETTTASLRLPDPRLTSDGARHSVRVAGGRLSVSEPAVTGDNVALALDWVAGALDADLRVARLAMAGTPPPMIPVGAALTARLSEDAVDFVASIAAPLGPLDGRIAGRHDLARQTGRADVAVAPVTFAPGVVQPVDLASVLGDRLQDVVGTVALDGTLAWTDVSLTPAPRFSLDGLGFAADTGRIEGLRGDVTLTGLAPAQTPPGQRLTGIVVLRETLVPLTLDFQARRDGRLAIELLRLDVAGGSVELRNTVVDPADPDIATTLEMQDVDLGMLLAQLGVEGLSGTGRLSGAVPLRLADGKVAIDAGRLAAAGGGRLSYTGSTVAQALGGREDAVGLAARTLADFRYDDLTLELEKSAEGPGTLRLTMAGRNPAVLEGYPFRFNIALETDFDRLARLLLEGLAAADDILRMATERTRG